MAPPMPPKARPTAARMPTIAADVEPVASPARGCGRRQAACGGGRGLLLGGLVSRRGGLPHLFADEPADPLVGREDCLPDADRLLDDLRDRRVPVPALAVVEDAVAPDHEVVGVAGGEGRRDLELLGGVLARALAIGQVGLAQAGERGVLGGVLDAHAEVATAAVEVKRADLENGLAAAGVEIAEGDEVAQELEQVAVVARRGGPRRRSRSWWLRATCPWRWRRRGRRGNRRREFRGRARGRVSRPGRRRARRATPRRGRTSR